MATKEQSQLIIKLARNGPFEGETGLKSTVIEALKMSADLDYTMKPYFRTALWEATWKNYEHIVKFLVEKGASVNCPDYQQRTPLHEAAYYGHLNLVEYLLEKGAELEATDSFGQTPLFRAVDAGRHDVVKFLTYKGAKTNKVDSDHCTVQHLASFQGFPCMSDWLLYHGSWRNRFALEGAVPRSATNSPRKLGEAVTAPVAAAGGGGGEDEE